MKILQHVIQHHHKSLKKKTTRELKWHHSDAMSINIKHCKLHKDTIFAGICADYIILDICCSYHVSPSAAPVFHSTRSLIHHTYKL